MDLQRDALKLSGVLSIYEEMASGKDAGCPALQHCLKALRASDILVMRRPDPFGRSLPDLVRIVSELEEKIGFESILERIETASAAGKMVFHVFAVFAVLAEFERNLILERTQVGLTAARVRGRAGGRKPKLSTQQNKEVRRLMAAPNIPIAQTTKLYKICRTTLYKVAPRGEAATNKDQIVASAKTLREYT